MFMRRVKLLLCFLCLYPFNAFADSLLLSQDAYGEVQIGMSAEQALAKLPGYKSDKLLYDEPYLCYYLSPKNEQSGVYIMIYEHKVARFDVYDPELNVTTQEHIGIGNSKQQVLNTYPNTKVSPHPYTGPEGEYLEVPLANSNGIIFETENNKINSFRLGSYPALTFIEGCS